MFFPVTVGQVLAAPALPSHRYWRILFTTSNGSLINITEIEVYDGLYGSNIAGSATVTASSDYFGSAVTQVNNGYIAKDNNDRFLFSSSSNEWLKLDFGSGVEKRLDSIGIHFWDAEGSGDKAPKDFEVQSSDDGSTWTTEWSISGQTSWASYEFRRFWNSGVSLSYSGSPYGTHRYWQIHIQGTDSDDTFCIPHEMEFLNYSGGTDLTGSGTATFGNYDSGLPDVYDASNLFDNNASTRIVAKKFCRVNYDFGSAVAVGAVSITTRNDSGPGDAPKQFCFRYADSSSGPWTTAFAVKGQTGWSLGEKRTFADPKYV